MRGKDACSLRADSQHPYAQRPNATDRQTAPVPQRRMRHQTDLRPRGGGRVCHASLGYRLGRVLLDGAAAFSLAIGPYVKSATNWPTVTRSPCLTMRLRTILLRTRTWSRHGIRTWAKCDASTAARREVVLTIDGLQPEKGHETLYVVREVTHNRVWFAEPLLSGSTAEVRKLFVRAKHLARTLRLKTCFGFRTNRTRSSNALPQSFPGCRTVIARTTSFAIWPPQFSTWTAGRRRKCVQKSADCGPWSARFSTRGKRTQALRGQPEGGTSPLAGASGDVVLDYCSVVRGILNDNHGGPAHPAGLRMLEALGDVQKSLCRVASSGKSGPGFDLLTRLKGLIDRGVMDQRESFTACAEVHPARSPGDKPSGPSDRAASGETAVAVRRKGQRLSTPCGGWGVYAFRQGDDGVPPRPVRECQVQCVSA